MESVQLASGRFGVAQQREEALHRTCDRIPLGTEAGPNRRPLSRSRHATRPIVFGFFVFLLTACYAPLVAESAGELSVRLQGSLPGMESGATYVARMYVVNAAYEDLLRRGAAYDDFLELNYYSVEAAGLVPNAELLAYYHKLELEYDDDLVPDLILKAPIKFGGRPYYQFTVSAGSGSLTLPGVPSNRSYLVFIEFFEPGVDYDEADAVDETVLWRDGDPYDTVLGGTDPTESGYLVNPDDGTRADAIEKFEAVRALYRDREQLPFIDPVFVPSGRTAVAALQLRSTSETDVLD